MKTAFFVILGVAVGTAITLLIIHSTNAPSITSLSCNGKYPLVNQLISCMSLENRSDRLHAVDTAIDTAVTQYEQEGKATNISVWVRDLKSNQTASTNETDTYDPASLLKAPLLIAYLKVGEIEPSILQTKLTYATTGAINDSSQDIAPQNQLQPGQSYTIEQLLEDMVINSDNNATNVLLTHLDAEIYTQTLIDLGLRIPQNNGSADFVTAKTYGALFRMLYNASYLNLDDSQKALEIMSKATFNGIRSPLPKDTVVADKFGEREIDNQNGQAISRELHDCGIVYKSSGPYVLCVMTKGKNFNDLQTVIQDISGIVYQTI